MVATGAAVGVLIGVARAKKSGEKVNDVLDLSLWVLIAGLIGSRIFFLFSDMDWTGKSRSVFNIIKVFFQFRQGGLVFYGGLLLAIAVGILFLMARKLNVWKFSDIAVPSVAIGIAFARIGCFFNGCCWGKPCPDGSPFRFLCIVFPEGSYPESFYRQSLPLYPTQLISCANAALLFVILSLVYRRKKFDGQVFWLFIAWYAVTRFLIEFLRGDNPRILFHTFTVSQAVGMLILPVSLVMLFVLGARARRKAASPSLPG
jgi:phosphatidylglycerol:prolipoprotein diacylglycerol transferase